MFSNPLSFSLPPKKKTILLLIILLLSSFYFLFDLGKLPLIDWDEAIYADVASDTLTTGHFFTLTRFGEPWFEKPPLYIWLVMGSIKLFGVSEFSLRLPSALLGIAAVVILYLLAFELSGNETLSFLTALILLFSSPFYLFGRQSRMDIPVTAAILFSLLCIVKTRKNEKWLMGFGAGVGIGILFKSIIGFLAFLPAFAYSFVYHDWRWLKKKYTWIGFGIAALIIAPWHIYETAVFGRQFWNQYFITQVFNRGITDMQGMTTVDYLSSLWNFYQPWAFAVAVLIPFAIFSHKILPLIEKYRKEMLFGLLSTAFIFAFFAIACTKMWAYLVPVYPFAAIFISAGLYYLFESAIFSHHRIRGLLSFFITAIVLLSFMYTSRYEFVNLPRYYFPYVYDQKAIGNYLKNQADSDPVFLYKWQPNESMEFYSGRIIKIVNSPPAPDKPEYLILASGYLGAFFNENPSYRQANKVYAGNYLNLLKTGNESSRK
ncbi:MAG TPA: glycosyltransferase family 39 protein [Candidatus Paceibacterota bacterium]|nr:glycosyltransferase family 39 protein [Candidatus Paceibacterota bacterium]